MAGAGLSLGASLITGATAHAASFEVDRTDDSPNGGPYNACDGMTANDCTLRDAVYNANDNYGVYDTITFAASLTGQMITLANGELGLYEGVNVDGPGADALTISGGNSSGIFYLNPSGYYGVTIEGLTLTDGQETDGGAIRDRNAQLTILDSVLTGNTATGLGGALYEYGYNNGYDTVIRNSTISDNTAGDAGGGVYARYSAGSIYNSTISGNTAGGMYGSAYAEGGGIYSDDYTTIDDSTITGNIASEAGGGVRAAPYGGPYCYCFYGTELQNTIVAGNDAPIGPDVRGEFDVGFSLIQEPTGATLDPAPPGSNVFGANPQLGPLQDNGGSTPTHLPAATSPVVDQGNSGNAQDQRGSPREVDNASVGNAVGGDASDMGAVELTMAEATPPVGPPGGGPPGGAPATGSQTQANAATGEDPKCGRARRKLKRREHALQNTLSEAKRARIKDNIRDTLERLRRLNCGI